MTFSEPIGQINAISISYQFSYSCCEHAVPNETDANYVSIVEKNHENQYEIEFDQ